MYAQCTHMYWLTHIQKDIPVVGMWLVHHWSSIHCSQKQLPTLHFCTPPPSPPSHCPHQQVWHYQWCRRMELKCGNNTCKLQNQPKAITYITAIPIIEVTLTSLQHTITSDACIITEITSSRRGALHQTVAAVHYSWWWSNTTDAIQHDLSTTTTKHISKRNGHWNMYVNNK